MRESTTTENINICANIPLKLANNLKKIAKIEDRSQSYYIRKSLEKSLEERLEDIEDYLDAKKAWEEHKASGEKTIPFEEVFRKTFAKPRKNKIKNKNKIKAKIKVKNKRNNA